MKTFEKMIRVMRLLQIIAAGQIVGGMLAGAFGQAVEPEAGMVSNYIIVGLAVMIAGCIEIALFDVIVRLRLRLLLRTWRQELNRQRVAHAERIWRLYGERF